MILTFVCTNQNKRSNYGQYLCIPLGNDVPIEFSFLPWIERISSITNLELLDGTSFGLSCDSIKWGQHAAHEEQCNTMFGKVGYRILEQVSIMHVAQLTATGWMSGQPLFVSGGVAYETEGVDTQCTWFCDAVGQLPDLTAAVHWNLGLLQRAVLMNRRDRESGIVPMEPARVAEFLRDTVPQAFKVYLEEGWWLPACLRDSSGTLVDDVLVEIRSQIRGGLASVRIWFKKAQFEIKREMEIGRELEWHEFSQWDTEGNPTGEASKWTSKVCLGKILTVATH